MVAIKRGVEPEAFTRGHTLFVEGRNNEAIDPTVLRNLLRGIPLRIRALGTSSNIRSVAGVWSWYHPGYYYLVDRDHHDLDTVEQCWQNFSEKKSSHLLIWRRRELENYFLIPEYIIKSEYINCSETKLKDRIVREAQQRIFLDAANQVIINLREEFKKNWIEIFPNIQNFNTRENALEQLLNHDRIPQKISDVSNQLRRDEIARRFHEVVVDLFGGQDSLQYGHGSWLERVSGKVILKTVINKCFRVTTENGVIQGEKALIEVVKNLLQLPLSEQPDDFQEFYKLVSKIVNRKFTLSELSEQPSDLQEFYEQEYKLVSEKVNRKE